MWFLTVCIKGRGRKGEEGRGDMIVTKRKSGIVNYKSKIVAIPSYNSNFPSFSFLFYRHRFLFLF